MLTPAVPLRGNNDGEMDDSLSLAASDATTPPPCILRSPAHPAQAWTPIFSMSCLMLRGSWIWNGLPQRNHPVASWMNGFCRCAARTLVNELRHSPQRSTLRSPNLGVHPTRASSSSALTSVDGVEKKYTTACLPWMSQWLRISDSPQPLAGR